MLTPFASAYTGAGSSEAHLTFQHWVELSEEEHSRAAATAAINAQLAHLFGPLSIGRVLGAPKLDEVISDVVIEKRILQKAEKDKEEISQYYAQYSYSGTMVLKNKLTTAIRIPLPNNPWTIWSTSVENKKTKINPCTDETYQGEGDFWYFWSPRRKGCGRSVLKEDRDYTFVNAHAAVIPNVTSSYPEYEKLPDEDGNILITLIMGKNEPSRIRDPHNREKLKGEENAKNFRAIEKLLAGMGFTSRIWANEEIKVIVREDLNPYPYVEEFTFRYEDGRTLSIRLVYTVTDIGSQSNGFHYFLENALEKSSVMIYDGHSGLGSNLDLALVRDAVATKFHINLNKTKYQIYFFNSCTSYAYYNDVFFEKKRVPDSKDKKGSKYLDILTTGLETAFDGSVQTNMALINAIHTWASTGEKTSYQDLAKEMESNNLFGVNGDEDNPKEP